jgi:hypothetical protein
VILYDGKNRKTVSYPKWLMEQRLGRSLLSDEVVHHKNKKPLDNRSSNLRIKNRVDHARDHQSPAELISAICPQCQAHIHVLARQVRNNQGKRGKAGPFCGRSCAGRWSRLNQIAAGK